MKTIYLALATIGKDDNEIMKGYTFDGQRDGNTLQHAKEYCKTLANMGFDCPQYVVKLTTDCSYPNIQIARYSENLTEVDFTGGQNV